MTLPLWPLAGRFWRMHLPVFASNPLGGEGARRHGGRWNAPGIPALYLSSTHATAIAEAHQSLVQPGTLVPYDVAATRIADLTVASDPALADSIMAPDWRRRWLIEHERPASWDVADMLIRDGAEGALVPSAVAPGTNLVLWRWNDGGAAVTVLDPDSVLPVGQASWQGRKA